MSFPPPCQHILFRRGVLGEGGAVFVHEGEAEQRVPPRKTPLAEVPEGNIEFPRLEIQSYRRQIHHADRQIIEAHVLVVHDPHIRHRAYFVADGRRQEHVRPPPE